MRVLWFVLAQLPAAGGQASMLGGGWLEGLRGALERHEPDLELGIVAPGAQSQPPLRRGNASYYSLGPWDRSRWLRAADAWGVHSLPEETISSAVRIAEEFHPDLIHVHGTEHALGFAAIRTGLPTVVTLQGFATVCEQFMLQSLPFSEIARNFATRSSILGHGFVPNYLSIDERAIVRQIDYFMGQTEWDRTVLELMHPGVDYFHTECIVQSLFYDWGPWRPPQKREKTLLCISGAAPYKGLETALAALGILKGAGRNNIGLRVAGAVPGSSMWAFLLRAARRNGIEDQVTWLGPLSAEQLVAELGRSDVFVLPSHIENQPNALIEAMLGGVPGVAAAVGGVPELIDHEVSGLLYQDREPYALAGAVGRLLDNEDLAGSLGEKAREVARARHDPEIVAHRTRAVYDAVLTDVRAGTL